MASQMAGTAGSWLRACCSACAAGADAPCSAEQWTCNWLLTREAAQVAPTASSSTLNPTLDRPTNCGGRAACLTCVQPGQCHPGGHALGVQLQRPRQRVLPHRRLQRSKGAEEGVRSAQPLVHGCSLRVGCQPASRAANDMCASHICCPAHLGCNRAQCRPQVRRGAVQAQAGTGHPLCRRGQAGQAGLGGWAVRLHSQARTQQLQTDGGRKRVEPAGDPQASAAQQPSPPIHPSVRLIPPPAPTCAWWW